MRYLELARDIEAQIRRGVLRAGERLPSLRVMSRSRGLSQTTVLKALQWLEDQGLVETRARSGSFVRALRGPATGPRSAREATAAEPAPPVPGPLGDIRANADIGLLPLGSPFASPELYPLDKLALQLSVTARRLDPWRTVNDLPPGNVDLRRHIARRYLELGVPAGFDDVLVTSGASEALTLSLFATTSPGDAVAVQSPCFYGALHALAQRGCRAVPIPDDGRHGMDLALLERAIVVDKVRAVWVMSAFQNPTGATMPQESRQRLVQLATRHGVHVIEDDVYSELHHRGEPVAPLKAFDRAGVVLHCGSFSKSLAPGYRVGWVASSPALRERLAHAKFASSVATNVIAQSALGAFVRRGGYALHLRRLRSALASQKAALVRAVREHLPEGTMFDVPDGGYFLWVRLPEGAPPALHLMRSARLLGIGVAAGPLFTPDGRGFDRCLRLNFGHPWSADMEDAVRTLGRLARPGSDSRHGSGAHPAVKVGG